MSVLVDDDRFVVEATKVVVSDDTLTVHLKDGRSISVPLVWYPRLLHGSEEERRNWQLLGDGYAVEWPQEMLRSTRWNVQREVPVLHESLWLRAYEKRYSNLFTYTGLRTNVGFLETWQLWGVCLLVLVAAIVGKLGGCGLAARLTGSSWREAGCIGALMNTRGLMELIVINVGKNLKVIPDSVYTMLVLMAIVTTMMTTPLVMRMSTASHP